MGPASHDTKGNYLRACKARMVPCGTAVVGWFGLRGALELCCLCKGAHVLRILQNGLVLPVLDAVQVQVAKLRHGLQHLRKARRIPALSNQLHEAFAHNLQHTRKFQIKDSSTFLIWCKRAVLWKLPQTPPSHLDSACCSNPGCTVAWRQGEG